MHEQFPTRSGADLVALREHLGISQEQVAEVIGRTQPTISRWESAAVCKPFRYALYEAACRRVLREASEATA